MSGKPDRKKAKRAVQLRISCEVYELISVFFSKDIGVFRSMSQFVETVIFCVSASYFVVPVQDFISKFQHIKVSCYLAKSGFDEPKQKKLLHLTIDVEALEFISNLLKKYRSLFSSRNELVELFLVYIAGFSDTPERMKYILQRLKQAQLNNPIRVDRSNC